MLETNMVTSNITMKGSMEGDSQVLSGEEFTVYVHVDDPGVYAVMGTLEYDSTQVTLISATSALKEWDLLVQDNVYLAEENNEFQSPLEADVNVMKFVFRVNEGVGTGTNINIAMTDMSSSNGEETHCLQRMGRQISVVDAVTDVPASNTEQTVAKESGLMQAINGMNGKTLDYILGGTILIVVGLAIGIGVGLIKNKNNE